MQPPGLKQAQEVDCPTVYDGHSLWKGCCHHQAEWFADVELLKVTEAVKASRKCETQACGCLKNIAGQQVNSDFVEGQEKIYDLVVVFGAPPANQCPLKATSL